MENTSISPTSLFIPFVMTSANTLLADWRGTHRLVTHSVSHVWAAIDGSGNVTCHVTTEATGTGKYRPTIHIRCLHDDDIDAVALPEHAPKGGQDGGAARDVHQWSEPHLEVVKYWQLLATGIVRAVLEVHEAGQATNTR